MTAPVCGEIFEQIGEPLHTSRPARGARSGPGRRRREGEAMSSKDAPEAGGRSDPARILSGWRAGRECPAAFGFAPEEAKIVRVGAIGKLARSSWATTAMVPSGVPNSCAAAAASAPSEASRCSRAKRQLGSRDKAADMRVPSLAIRQA